MAEGNLPTKQPEQAQDSVNDRILKALDRQDKRSVWKDIVLPLAPTVVALVALVTTAWIQLETKQTDVSLKQYEVTFSTKQHGYATLLSQLHQLFSIALTRLPQQEVLERQQDTVITSYYAVEPFLSKWGRNAIWDELQGFFGFCLEVNERKGGKTADEVAKEFTERRDRIKDLLNRELF